MLQLLSLSVWHIHQLSQKANQWCSTPCTRLWCCCAQRLWSAFSHLILDAQLHSWGCMRGFKWYFPDMMGSCRNGLVLGMIVMLLILDAIKSIERYPIGMYRYVHLYFCQIHFFIWSILSSLIQHLQYVNKLATWSTIGGLSLQPWSPGPCPPQNEASFSSSEAGSFPDPGWWWPAVDTRVHYNEWAKIKLSTKTNNT